MAVAKGVILLGDVAARTDSSPFTVVCRLCPRRGRRRTDRLLASTVQISSGQKLAAIRAHCHGINCARTRCAYQHHVYERRQAMQTMKAAIFVERDD